MEKTWVKEFEIESQQVVSLAFMSCEDAWLDCNDKLYKNSLYVDVLSLKKTVRIFVALVRGDEWFFLCLYLEALKLLSWLCKRINSNVGICKIVTCQS